MLVGDIITSAREIWPDLAATADSNGRMISAATAYRWLNQGLITLGRAAHGIYDTTGVTSVNGQGLYQLTNFNGANWIKFTKGWYDGWEFDLGNASNIFRRNATPAISWMMASVKTSNLIVVELFPQPDTVGGTTTLAADLSATATSATCVDVSSWQLSQGIALLSDGTNNEVIGFGTVGGNVLGQLTRGLGGTVATAFAAATPTNVTELNIRIVGFRMPRTNYAVGNMNLTLDVPMGWEPPLIDYMESRFRRVEKEFAISQQLEQQAIALVKSLASQNNMIGGPRQVGGMAPNEVYNAGLGGGWFLP